MSGRWEEEKDEGNKRKRKEKKRRTRSLRDARHSMKSSFQIRYYSFVICPNNSP